MIKYGSVCMSPCLQKKSHMMPNTLHKYRMYPLRDGQWIDVTGVPAGDYQLRVTINPIGVLDETDLTDNTVVYGDIITLPGTSCPGGSPPPPSPPSPTPPSPTPTSPTPPVCKSLGTGEYLRSFAMQGKMKYCTPCPHACMK